jgi:glycerophosphoryl diester phosphodiesterase
MKTKITAHRGYSEKYPENTLIAFEKAVERGADRIELDVHLTTDNTLIIHHDYYLGNPDNGEGLIYEKDSKYIQSLDVKGQKIPLLKEVFQSLKDTCEYELELKGFNKEFVREVLKLVHSFGLLSKCEFTSSSQLLLNVLKRIEPDAKIGYFTPKAPSWMEIKLAQKIYYSDFTFGNIDYAHCPLDLLTKEYVVFLQEKGIKVHVANTDSKEDIEKAFDLEVDQLSTNQLDLALSIRSELL